MGRRRLFRQDLGEHPPEIQEFLTIWHQYPGERDNRGVRRTSIGAPSSAEVRENARWFGRFLLLVSVLIPVAYWWYAGDRWTIFGYVSLFVFSAGFAAFGVALLRSGSSKRDQTVRSDRDA